MVPGPRMFWGWYLPTYKWIWVLGFLATRLWDPESTACPLMCGAEFVTLWWTYPCPVVAVDSKGLKEACLLVGGAVTAHSY